MSIKVRVHAAFAGVMVGVCLAFSASADPEAWYQLFPDAVVGDFNGDGRDDAFIAPRAPNSIGAVILGEEGGGSRVVQDLSPDEASIPWAARDSRVFTGDMDGDGRDDLIVQSPSAEIPSAIVLADPSGRFHTPSFELSNGYLGLDWSADRSTLTVGDFDADGRADTLVRSNQDLGQHTVVLSDELGAPASGPQAWRDGYLGRTWNSQQVAVYSGDFNGDHRADLLVQVVDDAVLTHLPFETAYALLLADEGGTFSQVNDSWDRDALGAEWSPKTHLVRIADIDGDGISDLILRSRTPNGENFLMLGTPRGAFQAIAARWRGDATAADVYAYSQQSFSTALDAQQGLQFDNPNGRTADETFSTMSISSFPAGVPAVGALAGEAGVSGGAATYSIPITVPPGRAGMQPSITLSYSSRGGNGELGMGWSVGAGSSIDRCGQTAEIAGESNLGVQLSSSDRLCLDGQRLIVTSGTYGNSGAVYRTELENYARVEQSGAGYSSASSKFLVRYNDGRIAYYGQDANSVFVTENASAPTSWLLSRVEDPATNSMIYTYDRSVAGEQHLASIAYTGRGTTAGNRSVTFTWESRSDLSTQWQAGGRTNQTKRLQKINTSAAGAAVREYRMYYGDDSLATQRTLLLGVEECAVAGGATYCLPKTEFTWANPAVSLGLHGAWANLDPTTRKTSDGVFARIDIDSDTQRVNMVKAPFTASPSTFYEVSPGASFLGKGQKELWYQNAAIVAMLKVGANGTGQVDPPSGSVWPPINGGNFWDYKPDSSDSLYDFDSDGRVDSFRGSEYWSAGPDSGGTVTWDKVSTNTTGINATDYKIADFNGDGKADVVAVVRAAVGSNDRRIVLFRNNQTGLNLSNGQAMAFAAAVEILNPAEYLVTGTFYTGAQLSQITDYNGDGRPDILFRSKEDTIQGGTGALDKVLINNSANGTLSFSMQSTNTTDPDDQYLWTDLNGDGMADLLQKGNGPNDTTDWQIRLNKGGTFTSPINPGLPGISRLATRTGDIDNDGKDEVFIALNRVATMCMQNIYFQDLEGQWTTDNLCGQRLLTLRPDLAKFDASIFQYGAHRIVENLNGSLTAVDTGIRFNAPATGFTLGDIDQDGLNDIAYSINRNSEMYYATPTDTWYGHPAQCGAECTFTFPTYGNYVSFAQQDAPDLMVGVKDGLRREATWTMAPLSSAAFTLADDEDVGSEPQPFYAIVDADGYSDDAHFYFTSTMYAVAEFKTTHSGDCINIAACDVKWSTRKYGYREAMYNNRGRGFRGFRTILEEDPHRGLRTVNTYLQKFPYGGQLESSITEFTAGNISSVATGADVSSTANVWTSVSNSATGRTHVRLVSSSSLQRDPYQSLDVTTTSSSLGYDVNSCQTSGSETVLDLQFGNRTSSFTATINSASEPSNLFCQVANRTTTLNSMVNARHGQAAYTAPSQAITNSYVYNSRRQVLTETTTAQDSPSTLFRTASYGYEDSPGQAAYGNVKFVTISGGSGATAISTRTATTTWSGDGYFPASVSNPLGQAVTKATDAKHGQPIQVTDPNAVDAYFTYDAFGRKATEQVEDLPVAVTSYHTCSVGGCDSTPGASRAAYLVRVDQVGFPAKISHRDSLHRSVEDRVLAFSGGDQVVTDTLYDTLGRVWEASEPWYWGGTRRVGWNAYDVLDRVTSSLDAKGLQKTISYTGGIKTVTAWDGSIQQIATQEKNSAGQLLTAIDHYGSKTHFRFDAFGNPTRIVDGIGAVVTATYNGLSQKTALADPDLGNWTYAYNVLGELKTQTDAKSQVTGFAYDNLGRMTSRSEGPCATTWTYDTASNGIGKLTSMVNSANCEASDYRQVFTYDIKGRVVDVGETIDGAVYNVTNTFDAYGRMDTLAYPSTTGGTGAPTAPTNVAANPQYSTDGNLTATWGAPGGGGALTEYRVYRRLQGQGWGSYTSVSGSTFSKAYTTLVNGIHEFKVVACNASGCGPDSATVWAEVDTGGGQFRAGGGKSGGGVSPQNLTSSYGTRFTVKHVYNSNGHLSELQDAAGNGSIWRANAFNAYGQIASETFGNNTISTRSYAMAGASFVTGISTNGGAQALSYSWNPYGQLTQRSSSNVAITPQSMTETFSYDLLNRLDVAQLSVSGGAFTTVMNVDYDAVGNITSKVDPSGTKTYAYPIVGSPRPHAVTSAGGLTYAYDANGNMNTRAGSSITWNAANLPTVINGNGYTGTFTYGPGRNRVKEVSGYVGRSETTVFVGSIYEKFSRTDQPGTQHRYRVFAYGKPVAQVTDFSSTSVRQARYLHLDHLGSVDAITNEAGGVVTWMSFDAHGNRRAAENAQGSAWLSKLAYPANASTIDGNGTTTGLRTITLRGFTGHEMLDDVGLIHMNGRVYDPGLGRFLSVDPVFQFPEDTQSLNPYSYVRNSPTTAIDPTGLGETAQDKKVSGSAESQNDSGGNGGSEDKPKRKLNEARDPRRSHFANANKKFDQPGATAAGTPTNRNLANGGDTRYAAARFDKLGKQLADAIESVSTRATELANSCSTVSCRSDFYKQWNDQLKSQFGNGATVFFGGAAKVTGPFQLGAADTLVPDFYSEETERFLLAANAHLFKFNAEIYIRLSTGADMGPLAGLSGSDLDNALVAFEQHTLESFAAKYFGTDFAMQGRVYNNLSTALTIAAMAAGLPGSSYTQQAVATNWPKGNFDFGNVQHRISLGQSIMTRERKE